MKLQLTIIALLLSLTATAQNIVLTSDRQEDKSVIIRVDKQGYGRVDAEGLGDMRHKQ